MRSRLPLVPMLSVVIATLIAAATGCQSNHADTTTAADRRASYEQLKTLPLKPEWSKFVEANYRSVVLADLTQRGRDTAEFVEPPQVIASRYKSGGGVELMAIGKVDTINLNSVRYRRSYTIAWQESGSGWDLTQHELGSPDRAKEPPPARPPQTPTIIHPASKPATKPE